MKFRDFNQIISRHDQCIVVQTPRYEMTPKIEIISFDQAVAIMSTQKTRSYYLDSVIFKAYEWDYENKKIKHIWSAG